MGGGERTGRKSKALAPVFGATEERRRGGRTPQPDGGSDARGDRDSVLERGSPVPLLRRADVGWR